MSITCTPDSLADAAKCLTSLSQRQLQDAQIYFLCSRLNGVTPTCTPDAIAEAVKCYDDIPQGVMDAIITYLYCQLANS